MQNMDIIFSALFTRIVLCLPRHSKHLYYNFINKLMEISKELNEIFFEYPFSVPPFFALITRGLGILEGIAISADPEFDIFQATVPFARKRALQLNVT